MPATAPAWFTRFHEMPLTSAGKKNPGQAEGPRHQLDDDGNPEVATHAAMSAVTIRRILVMVSSTS